MLRRSIAPQVIYKYDCLNSQILFAGLLTSDTPDWLGELVQLLPYETVTRPSPAVPCSPELSALQDR